MSYQLPLPIYAKGKNISSQSLQALGYNDDATINYGTFYDMVFLGVIDTWEVNLTLNGFEKHPTNFNHANYLGTFYDWDLTVGEIKRAGQVSILKSLYQQGPLCRFESDYSSDNAFLTEKIVFLATFAGGGGVRDGMVEGENGLTATLRPVGVPPWIGLGVPPF
jgi:hypothetical protein